MTVAATDRLIAPHGGTLVDRTGDRPDDLDSLETVQLTSRELSDLDMLASGALSPLEGFMGKADYDLVVGEMHLASGLPWALPVCLAVDAAPSGDRVVLADESGKPVAVLEVECRSAGQDRCRFLVGSPDVMDAVYEEMGRGTDYEAAVKKQTS